MRAHVNHRALMWWLLPVTCQPYGRWHRSLSWYVTPVPGSSQLPHTPSSHSHTHIHACILTHILHTDAPGRTRARVIGVRALGGERGTISSVGGRKARAARTYTHWQGALLRSGGPWRWFETPARVFFYCYYYYLLSSSPWRARDEVSWNTNNT